MRSRPKERSTALSLEQTFQAIECIKSNVSELVSDAQLLAESGSFARSYLLAYCAREELSKLMILLEASWKAVLGLPLDWRSFWVEMNDHVAKARQFVLGELVTDDLTPSNFWKKILSLQPASIMSDASSAFEQRNRGLYCDVDSSGVFRKPSELLSGEAALALIVTAKSELESARSRFHEKSFEDFKGMTERASARWLMDLLRSAELFNKYEDGSISQEEHAELYQKFGISESESRTEVLRLSRKHAHQMQASVADPIISRQRRGLERTRDLSSLGSAIKIAKEILVRASSVDPKN